MVGLGWEIAMKTGTRRSSCDFEVPEGFVLKDDVVVPVGTRTAPWGFEYISGDLVPVIVARLIRIPILGLFIAIAWEFVVAIAKLIAKILILGVICLILLHLMNGM